MLLNLSISSLFVSSLSNSPFFTSNNKYLINSCKFYRFFPIIFYQTQNLKAQDSYFTKSLSNLILIDKEDFIDKNINEINSTINKSDILFRHCNFVDSSSSYFTIICQGSLILEECLFSGIYTYDDKFIQITLNKATITGCCFSDSKLKDDFFLFAPPLINNNLCEIIFNYNVITEIKSEANFIRCERTNSNTRLCNFSKNIVGMNLIYFELPDQEASVSESQMGGNNALSMIYFYSYSKGIDITSVYFIDNHIGSQSSSAVFEIARSLDITIVDSIFYNFISNNGNDIIDLFAQTSFDFKNSKITLDNNKIDRSIYMNNRYTFPKPIISDYINNTAIFSPVASTPVPANSYLYQNYRKQCKIYLSPTFIFTQSDPFTKSDIFTPSDFFITASPSVSPTSSCSPSMSPSASASASPSTSPTPSPSLSPSVNAAYGIVGAVGTAVVSFGLSSLVWLSIRKCCIYDHDNYLHMDV